MDMDRYIGRLLDNRYEILEVIGSGGMSVVYKARCHRLNRLVAIKILKDENMQDEDFRRRFHAESQAVAMLGHPNIVSVYDVSSNKDADYIVMELIDGITLKQYMEKKGVLNWKETLHFAIQIAKALEHAHSKGLVHRDIKPHNVMVLKNGSVKVADFGIARIMSQNNTQTKEALGSVHYISPEQARGGRVDNRSDLYSLGVVMYEMITGRPPYDGESPVSVAIQHINGGASRPSALNPNIPRGLEQIIMKSMERDLRKRYPTATAMLYDMDELRKNPVMVFGPEIPVSDPNSDTRIVSVEEDPQKPVAVPPVKPERKEKKQTDRERQEANRSNVATIAIVVCALVALVAIILVLMLMLNPPSGNPTSVKIPELVGWRYEAEYPFNGITVQVVSSEYSDEFEVGEIIRQDPEGGTTQRYNTVVEVVLSLGPEPAPVLVPDNLIGLSKEAAQALLDGLNLGLNIQIKEENHDTVPAGKVLATKPTAGAVLEQGAVVTLTVSLGPKVDMNTMPDLMKDNGTKANAEKLLTQRGFINVRWEPVHSYQPKNEIVSQSVEPNASVGKDTEIIVKYSIGTVTLTYRLETLPADDDEHLLSVIKGNSEVVLEDLVISAGQEVAEFDLTGVGTEDFTIYLDGKLHDTISVEFCADE